MVIRVIAAMTSRALPGWRSGRNPRFCP